MKTVILKIIMMQTIRKTLIDKFQEHLLIAYSSHCLKHQALESREGFISFLIDQDLIPSPQRKRYAVWKEFQNQYCPSKSKTAVIRNIADIFNISERHTWSLIKYEQELLSKK